MFDDLVVADEGEMGRKIQAVERMSSASQAVDNCSKRAEKCRSAGGSSTIL